MIDKAAEFPSLDPRTGKLRPKHVPLSDEAVSQKEFDSLNAFLNLTDTLIWGGDEAPPATWVATVRSIGKMPALLSQLRKGDRIESTQISETGRLEVTIRRFDPLTSESYVFTYDAGIARGPKGFDGSNVLMDDEVVSQAIDREDSKTKESLNRRGMVRTWVGETNHTSMLREWISDLHLGLDRGELRPGIYNISHLEIPSLVTLSGLGGRTTLYGANSDRAPEDKIDSLWGSVTIRRLIDSDPSKPLIHLKGPGSALSNLTLDANGSAGTSLYSEAFEGSVEHVRIINGRGLGWDIAKANNGHMQNILVDSHGSATIPAVRIRSVIGAGSATHTNAQRIGQLTIERSKNTALQIGDYGTSTAAVEWLQLPNLHVEAPNDGGGVFNVDPLIKIINVKGVSFFDPLIYGGPGYLIEQIQDVSNTQLGIDPGGVRIIGGTLIGQELSSASKMLIHLVSGDNFAALGTKFVRYNDHAVQAESTFGSRIFLDSSCRFDISSQILNDFRSRPSTLITSGDSETRGHMVNRDSSPSITPGAHITNATLHQATDTAGRFTFGTSGSPVSGHQIRIDFARPYLTRKPLVTLTPASSDAANMNWHIASELGFFVVRFSNTPPANLSATAIEFHYQVIG